MIDTMSGTLEEKLAKFGELNSARKLKAKKLDRLSAERDRIDALLIKQCAIMDDANFTRVRIEEDCMTSIRDSEVGIVYVMAVAQQKKITSNANIAWQQLNAWRCESVARSVNTRDTFDELTAKLQKLLAV